MVPAFHVNSIETGKHSCYVKASAATGSLWHSWKFQPSQMFCHHWFKMMWDVTKINKGPFSHIFHPTSLTQLFGMPFSRTFMRIWVHRGYLILHHDQHCRVPNCNTIRQSDISTITHRYPHRPLPYPSPVPVSHTSTSSAHSPAQSESDLWSTLCKRRATLPP